MDVFRPCPYHRESRFQQKLNQHMAAGMALSRRGFIGGISSAGALAWPLAAPAQRKLESTSLRLVADPSTCVAPQYLAEALLREEGFADIGYVEVASDAEVQPAVAQGRVDFAM